jgi:hypothetical protein
MDNTEKPAAKPEAPKPDLRAEVEALRAENEGLKAMASARVPIGETRKFLEDRVPVLFDYKDFFVNRTQFTALHREFVKGALTALLSEYAETFGVKEKAQ